MKNIFLGLFLMLSLQSFGQNNFRGMNWGASSSQLKSNYPNVQWNTGSKEKSKYFATEDNVGGLKVIVIYYFIDDKLTAGAYGFVEKHASDNMYYEDFISISKVLNKKYDMEMNKKWNNTTYENKPNEIGYALYLGHVEITETYEDNLTSISHTISNDDDGGIVHAIMYSDPIFINQMKASQLEDF